MRKTALAYLCGAPGEVIEVKVAMVAVSLLIATGVAFAQDAAANQQEQQVIELIHLKYLDAASVAYFFGGTVFPNGTAYMQLNRGAGIMSPGSCIGGLYGGPRGGLRNSRLGQRQQGYDYGSPSGSPYSNPYGQGDGHYPNFGNDAF